MDFRIADIRLPTGTVHYRIAGDGPPVAAFHDSAGSRVTPMLETLARTRTVLMPIVPGFDGTPYHRSVQQLRMVHSMPGLANIMAQFIEATVGAPCDLIGQSFGARLALWVAAQRSDLAGRLVAMCPTGLRSDGRGGLGRKVGQQPRLIHAYPERAAASERTPAEAEINRGVPTHYHGDAPYDDELAERLSLIRAETLIVLGTRDGIVPPDVAYMLKSRIKRCFFSYVWDAAHALDSDQPERVSRLLTAFLERGAGFMVRQQATDAPRLAPPQP